MFWNNNDFVDDFYIYDVILLIRMLVKFKWLFWEGRKIFVELIYKISCDFFFENYNLYIIYIYLFVIYI